MNNALIGYTGFVGSSLMRQFQFESLFRSTNIKDIQGGSFETVVCAGAPGQKWIANLDPKEDIKKIEYLIANLKNISCKTFILISTVDVFKIPIEVDENSIVDEADLSAYGLHRRLLEKFIENHFPNHLIIRLPGLIGQGLKKNVIYDFLNNNNLHLIESRGVFQFYPMDNLWTDIQTALKADLHLVHLTAEPISVADVSLKGFGRIFDQELVNTPPKYDMRTIYSKLFQAEGNYQYNMSDTIQTIKAFAQSEPITIKP